MKSIIYVFCLLFFNLIFCQNRTVNLNDPISEIDINYTPVDGLTRLTVVLNTIETNNIVNGSNSYTADIKIEGLINWETAQTDSKKNILRSTTLSKLSNDKPFVLFADIYDGTNTLLKKPSSTNLWNKISFKLTYVIEGKPGQTSTLNFYPPLGDRPTERILNISTSAKQKESNKGLISFKSQPSGTPFEIREIKIIKRLGGNESSSILTVNGLGANRFSYNGELNLEVPTDFNIENINAKYFVSCKAVQIGSPETIFNCPETEIVFVADFDLKVLNRDSGYMIVLLEGRNFYEDKNIETSGNGILGIRFLDSQYKNIRPVVTDLKNSKYNIRLDGISEILSETSSTFYYTNGIKDISAPLTISKKLPKVTNFRFDGVKADSLYMSFNLPGLDGVIKPKISLSTKRGNVELSPRQDDKNDKSKYKVAIDQQISNIISGEEFVKDITISVLYSENILYNITVTVFNKKLYDAKMQALKTETDKKKSNRDTGKIKDLVENIAAMGTSVGNVINSEEVKVIINELQTEKGDKVKAVMSDIGKWVLIAGKIILPLLAV